MNFSIKKDRLMQSVNDCLRAVASKTPQAILTTIKFEVSLQGLKCTGSDSDISIESFIPAEEAGDEIIEVFNIGSICLNARLFAEIIRKLPTDMVEINVKSNFQTVIKSGKSEFKINGLDADEYPKLPAIDHDPYVLQAKTLKEIVRQTGYAVSSAETRPILTGINWKVENNTLICAATDSHRLSKKIVPFESSEDINIIIPGKSLDELSKLLNDEEEQVEISFTPSQILFKMKNILLYSRLLEGNYPDINRLIPTEEKTVMKINTRDFLRAVDRASILAKDDKSHTVKIVSNDGLIEISSKTSEVGNLLEEVQVCDFSGEEVTISFNARYMIEALRTIDRENVVINFTGIMRPFVLTGEDDTSMIQLILPVRTV